MAKKHLSPTLFLALSLGALSVAGGLVGCSHSEGTLSSDSAPPADAGTDAVPQAAVEDKSGTPPPTAPVADQAAPPAPDGAVPPPPADTTVAVPPPAAPDVAAAPAAPAAPSAPADVAQAPAPAAPAPSTPAAPAAQASAGDNEDYTVKPGDTLMKIAFENYGDLYKWKDIYQANQDHIKNPNDVPPGTVLKLEKPSTPVSIERNGDQYMIKMGDTLGTISTDVYGTKAKWKKLYENNKQLIKDPNKIYAGFYLFYTLTPEERQDLEKRGGPGQPKPLAEGSGSEPQAKADNAQPDNAAPAQIQAQAPVQAPQAQAPAAQDSRAPSSVANVAQGAAPAANGSEDLNQVAAH